MTHILGNDKAFAVPSSMHVSIAVVIFAGVCGAVLCVLALHLRNRFDRRERGRRSNYLAAQFAKDREAHGFDQSLSLHCLLTTVDKIMPLPPASEGPVFLSQIHRTTDRLIERHGLERAPKPKPVPCIASLRPRVQSGSEMGMGLVCLPDGPVIGSDGFGHGYFPAAATMPPYRPGEDGDEDEFDEGTRVPVGVHAGVIQRSLQRIATGLREEHGQDLIEYALLVGMVSLLAAAAINGLAQGLTAAFTTMSSQLASSLT